MMLDKKAVDMLLKLDDEKLAMIIKKLATDAGVNGSSLSLGPRELGGIRSALGNATDGDIQRAAELIKLYQSGAGK